MDDPNHKQRRPSKDVLNESMFIETIRLDNKEEDSSMTKRYSIFIENEILHYSKTGRMT